MVIWKLKQIERGLNKMTVEKITELIYQSINKNENGFDAENEKTAILNIEHSIGKYHAYMEILSDLDLEKFIRVSEETKTKIEELMHFVEKIYSI